MAAEIQSVVFTSLSLSQFQNLLRTEIESYFSRNPIKVGSNISDSDILDVDQAAEYVKLTVGTIHVLSSKKLIPVMKKGKKLIFSKQELTTWLKDGRRLTLSEIQKNAGRPETLD